MKTEMIPIKKKEFKFPCLLLITEDNYDDIVILATEVLTKDDDDLYITGSVVHINPQSKQNLYKLGVTYDFDAGEVDLYKGVIQLSNE